MSVDLQVSNKWGSVTVSSSARTGEPSAPGAPPAVTIVSPSTPGSLGFTWTAPADGGRAINQYSWEVRSGSWVVQQGTVNGSTLSQTVTGLPAGTYDVVVRARNSVGTGGWSPPTTATVS
ncbi:fibronectin type III domain-containing protein [Cellulomonas soli]